MMNEVMSDVSAPIYVHQTIFIYVSLFACVCVSVYLSVCLFVHHYVPKIYKRTIISETKCKNGFKQDDKSSVYLRNYCIKLSFGCISVYLLDNPHYLFIYESTSALSMSVCLSIMYFEVCPISSMLSSCTYPYVFSHNYV